MPEIARITYGTSQESVKLDNMGMRQMQKKVYGQRDRQYLLLKAPPASGKSRAFMYVALDKLYNQGLKKVIIAVPEKSIGASFDKTNLTDGGFFADWNPSDDYNLCYAGADNSSRKVQTFKDFLHQDKENILICTHATLRFAFAALDVKEFDGVFLGIDEFHHASADIDSSKLGDLVKGVIEGSSAHIMAMTGSYFRGDGVAVLTPEVERKITTVTYSYYDQLSGYKYLKGITLWYDFYQGRYFDRLETVLDTHRKTIIHIPNVNSIESTGQKYNEVDWIIDIIGTAHKETPEGYIPVTTADGRILKVIDLVDEENREAKQRYLREHAEERDAIDIIIALNLAKEGFDWPACEHMLTVGYRGSLTEIVQIIGRCTRDYPGKSEAYFTNLIAEPDATLQDVATATNNLLKAITASLLMEQVLMPKWNFESKKDFPKLVIKKPKSDVGKKIVEEDLEDLIADISTNKDVVETLAKPNAGKLINKGLIPKIIIEKYPDLPIDDLEAVRQTVVANMVLNTPKRDKDPNGQDSKFLKFPNGMILDIRELDINLIDSINPFEKAYQILSRDIDKKTLASIQDALNEKHGKVKTYSQEEVMIYWPQIQKFVDTHDKAPDRYSDDQYEAQLGAVLWFLRKAKEKQEAVYGNSDN